MKSLKTFNPATIGVSLFCLAAIVLIATIITGQAGMATTAKTLSAIAQPLCAMASAVLMYLAMIEMASEQKSKASVK